MPQITHWNRYKVLRMPLRAFFRRENDPNCSFLNHAPLTLRFFEHKIGHESQKRIMGPCAAAASIKKARMVSKFTLVNKFSANQSLVKCRSDQVKKAKFADSWIPWERSVSMLHVRTFRSKGFTDWKYKHAHLWRLIGWIIYISTQFNPF